jgi:small subunit ribosomal protein S14
MARKSKIAKDEKRRKVVARRAVRRVELNEIVRRLSSTRAERVAAQRELARQPRDASTTRVRDRDNADGRPRGYLRTFGLSRVNLRKQAHAGLPDRSAEAFLVT